MRQHAIEQGVAEIVFANDRPQDVPMCSHPKGTDFWFDVQNPVRDQWCWWEMVAQMDDASLDDLLGLAVADPPGEYMMCKCSLKSFGRDDAKMQRAARGRKEGMRMRTRD